MDENQSPYEYDEKPKAGKSVWVPGLTIAASALFAFQMVAPAIGSSGFFGENAVPAQTSDSAAKIAADTGLDTANATLPVAEDALSLSNDTVSSASIDSSLDPAVVDSTAPAIDVPLPALDFGNVSSATPSAGGSGGSGSYTGDEDDDDRGSYSDDDSDDDQDEVDSEDAEDSEDSGEDD